MAAPWLNAVNTTPHEAFSRAQAAVAAQDWHTLFECLSEPDVLKIAANSLKFLVMRSASEREAIILTHPTLDIDSLVALNAQLLSSAQTVLATPTDLSASLAHRDLVKSLEKSYQQQLKSTGNLAALAGDLETYMRSTISGGSVSSDLFRDETLVDVVVDGNRATGMRRHPRGADQSTAFVRTRGDWKIRLIQRRV